MTSRNRSWDRHCVDWHDDRSTLWPKARESPEFCRGTNSPNKDTQDSDFTYSRWIGEPRHRVISSRVKFPRSSQQVFGSQPPEWHDRPPQFARPNAAETTSNFGELADRDPRKKRASHAQATRVI